MPHGLRGTAGTSAKNRQTEAEDASLPISDDAIVKTVLSGDVNAFEALVTRHRHYVARIVAGHVPYDKIDEVTHDTFVNAYRGLNTYRGGERFPNWMSRIAVRCCYDFWRDWQRNREAVTVTLSDAGAEFVDGLMSDTAMDFYQEAARRSEAQEVLTWAMAQLSPEDRMVLTLTALEEKSVAEAAELLGWSKVNVKVRALRARRKLKAILSKDGIREAEYE